MVYSFDIFETLVTRKTASDVGIWLLVREAAYETLGQALSPSFLDDFPYIRKDAHRRANGRRKAGEITLDEIYSIIGERFSSEKKESIDALKALEIRMEVEYSFGISKNIAKALALLDQGERVILISDMYLNGATVRSILEKADLRLAELPLYLSSEVGLRKADGDLFAHVLEMEAIGPAELEHFGDNPDTDIRQAKRVGIKASRYSDACLNHHERLCLFEANNLSLQLFVGASRQARLQPLECGKEYRLGSGFTGPLFYGFVREAVESALERGEKRVFFLARDGHLLKAIADTIVAVCHYEIEVEYIYVSRKSLYPACFYRLQHEEFWWVFEEMGNERTFELALERLRLSSGERAEYFDESTRRRLGVSNPKKRLGEDQVNRMITYIQDSPDLRDRILAKSRRSRELLTEYLRGKGLLLSDAVTLIDIGWRGTAQDAIFRVLREANPAIKVREHYLGVSHYSHLSGPNNQKLAYVRYVSNQPSAAPVFEHLLQADHGRTIDYRETRAKTAEPVLEEIAPEQCDWDLSAYCRGIVHFSRILTENSSHKICSGHYRAITNLLIERVEQGDKEIAEALGDLSYGVNQEESGRRRMAPAINPWTALKFIGTRPSKRGKYTLWLEGSFLRSGIFSKVILRLDPSSLAKKLLNVLITSQELREIRLGLRSWLKRLKQKFLP